MPEPDTHELVERLRNPNEAAPDDQWQAAIALGDRPSSGETTAALIQALGEANGALTRAHAAEALGKLGAKGGAAPLIVALKDPYRLTRSYAARALGKLKDATAIPALLEAMRNDEFFGVRAEAAEALGKICEGSETKECQDVRRALMAQKAVEQEQRQRGAEEGRGVRVQGEVDRALERLKELLDKTEAVSEQLNDALRRDDRPAANRHMAELQATLAQLRRQRLRFGIA